MSQYTLYLFYMLVHLYTGTEQWPPIHTIPPPIGPPFDLSLCTINVMVKL